MTARSGGGRPFAVLVLVAFTVFRPAMRALMQDTRWRTPPSWGLALAAFVLAFLVSRAFALAYVSFFPDSISAVPQFLTSGAALIPMLLAAGLLVPLAEEVAFRGLMMRGQERAAGFTVAALATTAAFAVAHGVQVGGADAAVGHPHHHVLRARVAPLDGAGCDRAARRRGRPSGHVVHRPTARGRSDQLVCHFSTVGAAT